MDKFEDQPGRPISQWISLYDASDDRMKKVGIMVGVQIDGPNGEKWFNADYAICNHDLDIFDEGKGRKIAYGRAIKARPKRAGKRVCGKNVCVGYTRLELDEVFGDFCKRCRRYYKDREPIAKAKKMLEIVDLYC